jgi:hypothetical protein
MQRCYRVEMRRHLLWYGIAACWSLAAIAGLVLHHAQQALPAAVCALGFAAIGFWIGKRDAAARDRRRRS